MKRFNAFLNDGSYINVAADRMVEQDHAIRVYDGNELVAFVDTGAIVSAHLSERAKENQ